LAFAAGHLAKTHKCLRMLPDVPALRLSSHHSIRREGPLHCLELLRPSRRTESDAEFPRRAHDNRHGAKERRRAPPPWVEPCALAQTGSRGRDGPLKSFCGASIGRRASGAPGGSPHHRPFGQHLISKAGVLDAATDWSLCSSTNEPPPKPPKRNLQIVARKRSSPTRAGKGLKGAS
jgi:hypothetical protein